MLTPVQRKTLVFIERFQARSHGRSPSIREIGEGIGNRSVGDVFKLLDGLEQRRFIRRKAHATRAIKVLKPVSKFQVFAFDETAKELRRVS